MHHSLETSAVLKLQTGRKDFRGKLCNLKPISQKKRLARGGGKTANPVGPPFLFISCTSRIHHASEMAVKFSSS